MIDISVFLNTFLKALSDRFGERVYFVGLQGSYGRGEATETSDIDLVVILDELCAQDIVQYHAMLDTLPHRDLICGFLSGKKELFRWEPSDLFQFYHDTKPIMGTLDELNPLLDADAVRRAIAIGACNIYHGCVHNMLYEQSDDILKGLYKAASFVVQAIYFQQTGIYVRRQDELMSLVFPDEKIIVENFLHLKNGGAVRFREMSETLFAWAGKKIQSP